MNKDTVTKEQAWKLAVQYHDFCRVAVGSSNNSVRVGSATLLKKIQEETDIELIPYSILESVIKTD